MAHVAHNTQRELKMVRLVQRLVRLPSVRIVGNLAPNRERLLKKATCTVEKVLSVLLTYMLGAPYVSLRFSLVSLSN